MSTVTFTDEEVGLIVLALSTTADKWDEWGVAIAHQGVADRFKLQAM